VDEEKAQRLAREEEKEEANKITDKDFSEQMQTVRSVSKKQKRPADKEKGVKKAKTATFMKPE
jgi:hypothetical protein